MKEMGVNTRGECGNEGWWVAGSPQRGRVSVSPPKRLISQLRALGQVFLGFWPLNPYNGR